MPRKYEPRHQCQAKRRDGQPCGRAAIKGGNVCQKHGGSLPSVKAAAFKNVKEARDHALEHLVPLALTRLSAIAANASSTDRDVINAAKALLQAGGVMGGGTNVQVEFNQTKVEMEIKQAGSVMDAMMARLLMIKSRSHADMLRGAPCPTCGSTALAGDLEFQPALPAADPPGVRGDGGEVEPEPA